MFDKKLVYTTKVSKIYENEVTKLLTRHCTQETINNMPPLTGYRVYYVVPNDTDVYPAYVLYDDKGHPVDRSNGLENMACIIDMKRAHLLYKDVK